MHLRLLIEKLAFHALHMKKMIRPMNRKEFFKTSGRLLILGGITASAGYLIINKKVTAGCSVSSTCDNCGKFSKCRLPQARETKEKRITPQEFDINSPGIYPGEMSKADTKKRIRKVD